MPKPATTPMIAFVALTTAAQPSADAPPKAGKDRAPPVVYEDRGACPFEGCTYRAWIATEEVPLFDGPKGVATGVVVKKGERVQALTGVVYVRPLRVSVRRKIRLRFDADVWLAPGDAFHLLTYQGEGCYKVWALGAVLDGFSPDFAWDGKRTCSESPDGCDAEPEGGREAYRRWARDGSEWWVKLRTRSGAVGWTRETAKFDGKDALG